MTMERPRELSEGVEEGSCPSSGYVTPKGAPAKAWHREP